MESKHVTHSQYRLAPLVAQERRRKARWQRLEAEMLLSSFSFSRITLLAPSFFLVAEKLTLIKFHCLLLGNMLFRMKELMIRQETSL